MAGSFHRGPQRLLGWPLYFYGEPVPDDNDARVGIIHRLVTFFRSVDGAKMLSQVDYHTKHRAFFDYGAVCSQIPVEGVAGALLETPMVTLSCIGCALYEALFVATERKDPNEDYVSPPPHPINVRILHYQPQTPMRDLKSNSIGKFIAIRGTVIRASTIKPLLVRMNFVCTKCNEVISQHFVDGKYEAPAKCPAAQCRNKNVTPDRSTAVTIDWQKIRLQDIVDDDRREEGRMPRTVECELTGDLVDTCIPGDEVTVSGIVKVVSTEAEQGGGRNKNRCLFLLYVDANSVVNKKKLEQSSKASDQRACDSQFSRTDLQAIKMISEEPSLFRLLVNSLCPAIYGHEVVKAALLVALVGGNQKFGTEKNKLAVRGDIHVLIVGDPGLGKSQMLQVRRQSVHNSTPSVAQRLQMAFRAASSVAPRGVYVCGNTTSSAGLTVTVVKDGVSGDFVLEAGALVLGDQGVCCVDEFDKMGGEQQALLEAMEQQSISIAKAGIVCSLSARTAVIAAANPTGGHYNRAKTVNENLKLSRAILSRFDLTFILLDEPDADRDAKLSEHVMAVRAGFVPSGTWRTV